MLIGLLSLEPVSAVPIEIESPQNRAVSVSAVPIGEFDIESPQNVIPPAVPIEQIESDIENPQNGIPPAASSSGNQIAPAIPESELARRRKCIQRITVATLVANLMTIGVCLGVWLGK